MGIGAGKPEHGHMTGHSGSMVPGLKKSMAPNDFNPSGHNSKHEKM